MALPLLTALLTALAAAALPACNLVKLTADSTADVLEVAMPANKMESDLQLAREAAPGLLKTVEGFLLASPDNEKTLGLLAMGYVEYAFGFLDDDVDRLVLAGKEDEAAPIRARATGLFLRGTSYALRKLGKGWEQAFYGDLAVFEKKVAGAGKGTMRTLFVAGLGLGSAINLNRDDIELVAHMPRVKIIMERLVQVDEGYYNGGAHLLLGMFHTAQGKALGGDPDKGKAHFERAIALSKGRFLLPKVLYALAYGQATQDRAFFHKTLVDVLSTSPAVYPEERLANELAHVKARRYLAHEKELF